MDVPDAFADKLFLHNSFEHFEGDADTGFVREAWRVLKPGGRVCIVPLYLSTRHQILTDPFVDRRGVVWDPDAEVVERPATTTGSGGSTACRSSPKRVLEPASAVGFEPHLHHVRVSDESSQSLQRGAAGHRLRARAVEAGHARSCRHGRRARGRGGAVISRRASLLAALLALACAAVVLSAEASTVLVVFGLPLVLLLPGYALTSALFARHDLQNVQVVLLTLTLSFVTVILGTFVLHWFPGGLTTEPVDGGARRHRDGRRRRGRVPAPRASREPVVHDRPVDRASRGPPRPRAVRHGRNAHLRP